MSRFQEDARRIIDDAHSEYIKILVWGPGDPANPAHGKRVQVKETLKEKFPRAEVYFSEDPEMVKMTEGIRGQLTKEALQARVADLVLMLDVSRGTNLELDYFVPKYPWFRDKVFVLLPEQHVGSEGLAQEVLTHLKPDQVEGFSEEELSTCKVASERVVKIAETIALELRLRRA